MYFRRAALVWRDCVSNWRYITKEEIKGCAVTIMNPFVSFSNNDLNFVWNTA